MNQEENSCRKPITTSSIASKKWMMLEESFLLQYLWGYLAIHTEKGQESHLEVLLNHLDGEEDPGFDEFILVIKERNFINNMRTVYRESEDQLPGIDTTNQ